MQYVLAAIKAKKLLERLESYLAFKFYHLRKDFNAFMAKELKVSDTLNWRTLSRSQERIVEAEAQSAAQTHLSKNTGRMLADMRPERPTRLVVVVVIALPEPGRHRYAFFQLTFIRYIVTML